MFNKVLKEINGKIQKETLELYLKKSLSFSPYFTKIDYSNNLQIFINVIRRSNFYSESNIIENYLHYINNILSSIIDIYFIPLFPENNTIISPELCILFLLKQKKFKLGKKEIKELYKKIIKGESTINMCLSDNNKLDKDTEINEIFNSNFTSFLYVSNNTIRHGVIYLEDIPYYFAKYTYPNYNSLKEFKSDFFLLDQINYYLFASLKEPTEFSNFYREIILHCFFLIIILNIFVWMICLIINCFVFSRLIIQLTEPIKKLQEAIESSSIADDTIFKYEHDDKINELFITSKELLTGIINKNDNNAIGSIGSQNFNVLSILKDEKKMYNNNFIINNDIINQLITEQQQMFDFSNNIKNNDLYYNIAKDKKKYLNSNKSQTHRQSLNLSDTNNKINLDEIIDKMDKTQSINSSEDTEDKEKEYIKLEPYKKLFKMTECFNYYLGKIEQNNIYMINNEKNEDNNIKRKYSKISRKINRLGSIKMIYPKSLRSSCKSIINQDDNITTINMMNKKNIAYLWYMDEKKKNSKIFNYNISNNYNELFNDNLY